ncbi:zf-HC2 domain-containing protein [Candidatus Nitrospira bockiana]
MTREEIKIYVLDYLAGRMTCKEFVDMVTDYLDGTMRWPARLRFHLHLGLCLGCRNYLQQMRHSIRTLGALPPQPPPPTVREELARRFKAARRP